MNFCDRSRDNTVKSIFVNYGHDRGRDIDQILRDPILTVIKISVTSDFCREASNQITLFCVSLLFAAQFLAQPSMLFIFMFARKVTSKSGWHIATHHILKVSCLDQRRCPVRKDAAVLLFLLIKFMLE
jgi:hypothetical protein